jgi:DNA helicase-2/ATP-dependent DNA helicase PcrA
MTPELQAALAGLNPAQREAVLHQSGPLLILAGAGSGKTRVVTVKIAYLIEELAVDPRAILAVTFTNKAAGEMRARAAGLVEHASDVTIRTFHSFGAWLLRRNADVAGLPRGFAIYDDDDSITLLRALYPEQKRAVMARFYHLISRAKDYCLGPDDDLSDISTDPEFVAVYRAYQKRIEEIGNVDFGDLIMKPVALLENEPIVADRIRRRFRYVLVDEYQDSNVAQYRLLTGLSDPETFVCVVGDDDQSIYRFRGAEVQNILTFPDTFDGTKVVRLEQNYRSTGPILDVAGAVVSHNEGRLGKSLFTDRTDGDKPRLALLEDHESEVEYVIDRVKEAERRGEPGETAVLYRTNAQSRPFETRLLRENIPYRIVGAVRFYDREEVKDAVAFLKFLSNPRDEVSFRRIVNKPSRGIGAKSLDRILQKIAPARGDLAAAADYAIPEMSKKAAAALAEFVQTIDELKRIIGGGSGAAAPGDDAEQREDAERRANAVPRNEPPGAGGATSGGASVADSASIAGGAMSDGATSNGATSGGASVADSASIAGGAMSDGATSNGATSGGASVADSASIADSGAATLAVLVEEMLGRSGLSAYHHEQDEVSGTQKVQNLEELVNAASLYPPSIDGLNEFLEAIELDSAREQEDVADAKVVLITMHNTKGLEFERVIITGLEETLFPRDEDPEELEEERRLFYVAITRAKSELRLTSCRYRRVHGRLTDLLPSRFLSEIPPELVDIDKSGRFGTSGTALSALRGERGDRFGGAGEEHPWPKGTAVYHDDYGPGIVSKAWYSGAEAVVVVRFETGATAQFLPKYTPLERIAGAEMEEMW